MSESADKTNIHWPQRQWEPLPVMVGPCAWSARLLADKQADGLAYVRARPSLVVVEPEDDGDALTAVAEIASELPILLRVHEPDFTRRFEAKLRQRIEAIGAQKVAVIALTVEDAAELKSGGLLQVLFTLRQAGLFDHIALATDQVNTAEWLSGNTAVRGMVFPYGLRNQTARYRALSLIQEMGQAAIAINTVPDDVESLAFALGDSQRVLPMVDRRLPENFETMTSQQVSKAWERYQTEHQPPAPLPRSHPPE